MSQQEAQFTAVVLAADREIDNPVARAAGTACKAFAPVAGVPMVLRVLDALKNSDSVGSCVLCGPSWSSIEQLHELRARITSDELTWIDHQATPSSSAYQAMQSLSVNTPVLITSSDHAMLSPQIVDNFCRQARACDCDVVAALASYKLVNSTYPEVRRTTLKFRDGVYCSCNLFGFLTSRARVAADFWRRVEQQRKSPLRVIGALGWFTVLRYILGMLSLEQSLHQLSGRLGVKAGTVLLPYAQAAVDVDTVADWQFVQKIITE